MASSAVMVAPEAAVAALWLRGWVSVWMTTPERASTWLWYWFAPEVKETR